MTHKPTHEASSGETPAFLNVFKGIAELLNFFPPCDLAIPGRVMTRKNKTKFAWVEINYENAGWQMLWLHKQKLRWIYILGWNQSSDSRMWLCSSVI
jgi:hypothetical protein